MANKIKKNNIRNRGAALLIAILISGVSLAVGAGIYSRVYKELIFSSFWRQAQGAFSAADAGFECAMYWDRVQATTASCFGSSITNTVTALPWNPSMNAATASFINVPTASGCVDVVITKDTSTTPPTTTIISRGHSTCSTNALRLVERALGVTY